jgi:uncharacterized protein
VLGPDNAVVPDIKRKLPGRGCWVSLDRATLETAIRKKAFARALKADAKAGADLPDLVDRLLEQDALAALALANKAGKLRSGFMKVEAAILSEDVLALVEATEAAADSVRKMRQVLARGGEKTAKVQQFSLFSTAQLGLCLGRENVIHACALEAPISRRFVENCRRLILYRTGKSSEPGHASEKTSDAGPSLF